MRTYISNPDCLRLSSNQAAGGVPYRNGQNERLSDFAVEQDTAEGLVSFRGYREACRLSAAPISIEQQWSFRIVIGYRCVATGETRPSATCNSSLVTSLGQPMVIESSVRSAPICRMTFRQAAAVDDIVLVSAAVTPLRGAAHRWRCNGVGELSRRSECSAILGDNDINE